MSNSLDSDQARRFVGPDLGPYCLHRALVGEELINVTIRNMICLVWQAYILIDYPANFLSKKCRFVWIQGLFPDMK